MLKGLFAFPAVYISNCVEPLRFSMRRSLYILLCLLLSAALNACAVRAPSPPASRAVQQEPEDEAAAEIEKLFDGKSGDFAAEQCAKARGGNGRDECYRYSGTLQAITANEPSQRKSTKIVKTTRTNSKGVKVRKTRKIVMKGRCQPQCLIYARCRSGFMSCRMGNTNPVRWWPCAKSAGLTSQIPLPGSVLLLDRQRDQRMRVGHAVYVEEVCRLKDGRYLLRVSHSNYNRMCALDLDARVLYNVKTRSAEFISGAWADWAKDLRALGFVTG